MAYDKVKTIRVDESEWKEASEICEELHLSLSTVVNILIKQIIVEQGIPIGISLKKKGTAVDSGNIIIGDNFDELIGTDANTPVKESLKEPEPEPKPIDLKEHSNYKHFADTPSDGDGYRLKNKPKEDIAFGELLSSALS